MAKKKNGDVAAIVPPNEVCYRGVRKKSSGRYGAKIRNPTFVWLGTFDTPEQAARTYDMAARKYHGPKVKTNFPPTKKDNLENVNPMNVGDVNNPYQSSDFRSSSSRSRNELVNNQNPLLTRFSIFNSDDSAPPQTALEEYYLVISRRGGVISCDSKQTNYIQKETIGDFIDGNDSGSDSGNGSGSGSGSGCEIQDQPPTTNHLELNLDLTLAPPGAM